MLRRALILILLLTLAACVGQPVHEAAGEQARLRSWMEVRSVNGEAPADPFLLMLAPGDYELEVVYRTFTNDYLCRFRFEAAAGSSYEIVDHSNPQPLVLYRVRVANPLWTERRDPIEPVCEAQPVAPG